MAFEKLPIFLFNKEALFEIGKLIGKPIKVDGYTANKSKLNQASVCIELDITKPRPTHVWINLLDSGMAVKVSYSQIPAYCTCCKKLGHEVYHCLANETVVEPPVNSGVDDIPHYLHVPSDSILGKPPPQNSFVVRGGRNPRGGRGGSRVGTGYLNGRSGKGGKRLFQPSPRSMAT